MRYLNLVPLTTDTVIYAWPQGTHYHLDRDCMMLAGKQFKQFGYVEIKPEVVKRRKLAPCACCYKEYAEMKRQ